MPSTLPALAIRLLAAAGAGLLLLLLVSAARVSAMHAGAAGALLALTAVTAWRAAFGVLIAAAVVPIASVAAAGWAEYHLSWVRLVVVACLAGLAGGRAIRGASSPADPWLRAAALAMAMVVTASAAVQLATVLERLGGAAFGEQIRRLITDADLAFTNRTVPAVSAATVLLLGLGLYYGAARCAQASPAFPRRFAAALALGAAAAAAVNIWRVTQAFARANWSLASVVDLLGTARINEHYGDMNAAGSYFVLALWTTAGLARGRRVWIAAAAAIAAALWLTGSRAALLAGILAAIVPLMAAAPLLRARRRLLAAAGAAVMATAVLLAWLAPHRGNQQGVGAAVAVRVGLTRTALAMLATRPLFGIGAGEFYQRSGEFSSPALLQLFPPAQNENAHNNFLQILAELGLLGFAAFIWLLALAARRVLPAIGSGDHLLTGMAAGLTAFLITCLGGHPLLTPEVSATFWLVLGTLCGTRGQAPAATRLEGARGLAASRRLNLGIALTAVFLAATLPLRAGREVARTNLDHVGIGLSSWHRTEDNQQYRVLSQRTATVFVPADASSVLLPLRSVSGLREVELRLDGQPANVVAVPADRWSNVRIVLPPHGDRRFRRVDLAVRGTVGDGEDVLLVGKVVAD